MDEKKQGTLSRLFGTKRSGCCDVKIEEVIEETSEGAGNQASDGVEAATAKQVQKAGAKVSDQGKPCCGGAPSTKPRSRCCG
jgi:hypothetical protein